MSGFAPDVALDTLFRRNAATRPDACALHDMDGTALTYAEMTNAIVSVAEQIASLGLATRSSIALLLPNGRELAIALLAVLRSGHVAVPMPVAWRKSDLVRGCREAEVAALITTVNFGAENLPELAAEVAIEVFELSFPCAFGAFLPDGIVPFTLSTQDRGALANAPIAALASPGIGTLEPASRGMRFVHHQDEELLAAGLGAMLAGDVQSGDRIVSAISLTTFAGLATAFVPWLLCGGTLTLLPGLPGKGGLAFDKRAHVIASDGALASLCALDPTAIASAFAVHFAGTDSRSVYPAMNAAAVVDVIALGEMAAIALRRTARDATAPLPLGTIHAGNAGAGSPVIAEIRIENGRIEIRGAIVPKGIEDSQEWLDTGYGAEPSVTGGFYAKVPNTLVCIGALRFDYADLERRIRSAALVFSVDVVSHPVLGSKIVISSERPDETSRALLDAGLPRIIAASVRKADAVRAKAS